MEDRLQELQELDPQIAEQQPLDLHDVGESPAHAPLPTALATKGTKRGRKAQDPQQVIHRFDCNSQQSLEEALHDFLQDESHDPQHSLFEAALPVSAAFLVDYGPAASGAAKSNSYKYGPAFAPGIGPVKEGHVARSMSVMEALEHHSSEPKERMRKQRAISRAVEHCVEQVDGHRYAFHNEWLARDNDAYRFSYFCNDSLLNKDRTLGGVKKNDESKVKRARKQVYDCQGYLTIKFSATKQNLEVLYKHIPVHPTYDERAPLPRVGTKRFEILQKNDPNNELVQRAKEREARKHVLAAKALQKRPRGRPKLGAHADASAPETPIASKASRRKTPDDGEEVAPNSATGFRFRNLTVDTHPVAKKAKIEAAKSEAAAASTPASARKRDEASELRARLQATEERLKNSEQYIKDMQSHHSPGQGQSPWPNPAHSPGYPPAHLYSNGPHTQQPPPGSYPPQLYQPHALPHSPYEQSPSHASAPQSHHQRSRAENLAAAAAAAAQPLPPHQYSAYPPHPYHYPPPHPQHPYYAQSAPPLPAQAAQPGGKALKFTHYQHKKSRRGSRNPAEASPGAAAHPPDFESRSGKKITPSATAANDVSNLNPELLANERSATAPSSGSEEDVTSAAAGTGEAAGDPEVDDKTPETEGQRNDDAARARTNQGESDDIGSSAGAEVVSGGAEG